MSTDLVKGVLTDALEPFVLTRKPTAKLLFNAKDDLSRYEPYLRNLPNNGFFHYESFINFLSADENTNPNYHKLIYTTVANQKRACEELWKLYRSAWS